MDLVSLLADVDTVALDSMSHALDERASMLAREGSPVAQSWAKVYGYLAIEMDSAALRQRTGIAV